jgi:hypothetical protein
MRQTVSNDGENTHLLLNSGVILLSYQTVLDCENAIFRINPTEDTARKQLT